MKKNIIAILGPTASGKTGYSLKIAQEIIKKGYVPHVLNCDSLQLMDGLQILTAAPKVNEKAICEHHLFSVLQPDVKPTAQFWLDLIEDKLEELLKDEKNIPIIVGGTGLYFDVLKNGISNIPKIPNDVREFLVLKLQNDGREGFYKYFESLDKRAFDVFNKNDIQRVLRACEVKLFTKKSIIDFWEEQKNQQKKLKYNFLSMKITPEKNLVYENCKIRLGLMLQDGVLNEVSDFDKKYPNYSGKLKESIGFTAFLSHIHEKISLQKALDSVYVETRQYAKRQYTWFNNRLKNAVSVCDDLQKLNIIESIKNDGKLFNCALFE